MVTLQRGAEWTVDVIVHGDGPLAGARLIEKPEADFGGRAGPILRRRSIRSPMGS
jgi:hypothetical protein